MPAESQLTRRSAFWMGVLFFGCGVPPVLGALRVLPVHPSPGVPTWMGVAAGAAFLLAGVLLFADSAAGGTNPDGSMPAAAPAYLRHIQTVAGMAIVLLMAVMLTWIAFGRGERHFSSTITLPFLAYRPRNSELPGRIAFGIGASLIWLVLILGTVAALKKHLARLRSA